MIESNHLPLDPAIQRVIDSLYREARGDTMRMAKGAAKALFRPITPSDMGSVYMPVSQEQGKFVYRTILDNNCKNIVEFGTSFGISALFLGAGAQKTGGSVVTTEIIPGKAEDARKNFEKAGLSDVIEIRVGNALNTLSDIIEPIDFLLLDGWKDLYLPLFKQLEPRFSKGTIIYSDNVNMTDAKPLMRYIRTNPLVYETQTIHQGKAELTRRR